MRIQHLLLGADMRCSSPTMARCSAAKKSKKPLTNFMAPGKPNAQVAYGV